MVLDLKTLVPNGYFRTYWVEQNITDLSQYEAAVSDLFRSRKQYRDERVLIRKKALESDPSGESFAQAADLLRLVPENSGVYQSTANPTADSSFALLETKLLAPHLGPAPASQIAPQVELTSGEQGSRSDFETRIDVSPQAASASPQPLSALKDLLEKTPILASLAVESTERDSAGVFVRIHSAIVLATSSSWDDKVVRAAVTDFVRPAFTASELGLGWTQKNGYQQLDGLWNLNVSVRDKYLVVSDDPALMESLLANVSRNPDRKPLAYAAGFNHHQERDNFVRFTTLIDRPIVSTAGTDVAEQQPKFFSQNMASLSTALGAVSAERIESRSERETVRQTVTYEWSQ